MRGRSRFRSRSRGGANSLLSQATALLGTAPLHYWDFTTNRALFNGVDVGAVTATPNWSFTRASTSYAQTLAGTLVSFNSGVPRLTNKGLLSEGTRANLLLQSQTLGTAPWSSFQSSISADATAAPDGTITADKLVEDTTAASTHFTQQSVTLTASVQTISVYAKAAERSQILFFIPSSAFGDATARFAYFDLATGAVGALSGAGATSSIEALASGWYRCILNLPATLAVAVNIQIGLAVAGSNTFTGNGTSGLFLWGAQVEAAATHSSYITTTTVTVTRAADLLLITGVSLPTPLSLFVEVDDAGSTTSTVYFGVATTLFNESIYINKSVGNAVTPIVVTGGVAQITGIASALVAGISKQASRIQTNNVGATYRGSAVQTDVLATMPLTSTQIGIGGAPWSSGGGAEINGYVRRAAIFNTALADTALQRAST